MASMMTLQSAATGRSKFRRAVLSFLVLLVVALSVLLVLLQIAAININFNCSGSGDARGPAPSRGVLRAASRPWADRAERSWIYAAERQFLREDPPGSTAGDPFESDPPRSDRPAPDVPPVHSFDQKLLDDASALRGALSLRGDWDHDAWEVVDWDAPIPPEDEAAFRCEWTVFVSSTGEKAFLCDGTPAEVVECASGRYFTDVWYRGYGGDGPVYVDVGAGNGACVLEMLLETGASILAFEQDPRKVYGIRKTMAGLDEAFRRRVTLFPINLADERTRGKISHRSVYAERLDAVLDADALPPKASLMIDVEFRGWECKVLKGVGRRMADRIEVARLKWDPNGGCRGDGDSVDLLRGFGFDVYRDYDLGRHGWAGVYRRALPVGQKPKFDGIDLYASRKYTYRKEHEKW